MAGSYPGAAAVYLGILHCFQDRKGTKPFPLETAALQDQTIVLLQVVELTNNVGHLCFLHRHDGRADVSYFNLLTWTTASCLPTREMLEVPAS